MNELTNNKRTKDYSNFSRDDLKEVDIALPENQYLASGTTGAVHELVVCADLMRKGYYVFRSVSQSCPCDLVVIKNGQCLKVEVTTGVTNKNGTLGYPSKDKGLYDFDILAVVLRNGSIHYFKNKYTLI